MFLSIYIPHYVKLFPTLPDETLSDYAVEPLPLCMSQNQALSWIATGLIVSMHINAGLVWAVTKHCKWIMKVWLVQAAVWCVIFVYIGVLSAFGQPEPDYGKVVVVAIGYIIYVVFIVLVAIFHEVGHLLYVPLNINAEEHREYLIPNEVLSSTEPIQVQDEHSPAVNQLVGDSPSGH